LYDKRYFYGVWESKKRAAHSSGPFIFSILPQGDVIVGYTLGPDRKGNMLGYRWAMGRNPNSLAEAKNWFCKTKVVSRKMR